MMMMHDDDLKPTPSVAGRETMPLSNCLEDNKARLFSYFPNDISFQAPGPLLDQVVCSLLLVERQPGIRAGNGFRDDLGPAFENKFK